MITTKVENQRLRPFIWRTFCFSVSVSAKITRFVIQTCFRSKRYYNKVYEIRNSHASASQYYLYTDRHRQRLIIIIKIIRTHAPPFRVYTRILYSIYYCSASPLFFLLLLLFYFKPPFITFWRVAVFIR